jgi:putative membrane protein insertion efficiency factor
MKAMAGKTAVFLYLLPRNIVVVVLRGYRTLISPLYGDVCRYYPSCSHFGLQAIQQRGLILGSVLTLRRLGRCHPWARGGVDDVPPVRHQRFRVTSFGFVVMNSDGRA